VIIGLTGATGHLGRRVAQLLADGIERGDLPHVERLVAVTRRPAAAADLAARGVDVRAGDFDRPAGLPAAFAGVDRLLVVSTDDLRPGQRVRQHRDAIDAAVAAGVRHLVYTSVTDPTGPEPAELNAQHHATEEHLRAVAPAWTSLRNSIYADLLVQQYVAPTGDAVITNAGQGRAPYVARDDCAAAAAAVLASPDGDHVGQVYDVTGPQSLTVADLVPLLSRSVGAELPLVEVTDEQTLAGLVAAGLPEPVARIFTGFGIALRSGHFDVTSDAVERLTGRPPLTVEAVLAAVPAAAPAA
jgi:NAD(P)H dehydrogenase (quinone)